MMDSYFISDIHLTQSDPRISARFFKLIEELQAQSIASLYILGDFFEAWVGDDACDPLQIKVAEALRNLSEHGVKIFIMHGNRDFLIGKRYAKACGATLLKDPSLIQLGEHKILLCHGDSLCTDDKAYQLFRRIIRNRYLLSLFSKLPVKLRLNIARKLRNQSMRQKKAEDILDVNPNTAVTLCEKYQTKLMIHGHTHRPAIHRYASITRIVLSDWEHRGQALILNDSLNIRFVYF